MSKFGDMHHDVAHNTVNIEIIRYAFLLSLGVIGISVMLHILVGTDAAAHHAPHAHTYGVSVYGR